MIKFSFKTQSFYDADLNYSDLPSDLIDVSEEEHLQLLEKINSNCIILPGLTSSDPKPTQYHTWNGLKWTDDRTAEEKRIAHLATLKNLTRRQFRLTLLDYELLDDIEQKIIDVDDATIRKRIQIEYDDALEFSRTSETVAYMCQMLGLTDSQVDEMWEHAMQIAI